MTAAQLNSIPVITCDHPSVHTVHSLLVSFNDFAVCHFNIKFACEINNN